MKRRRRFPYPQILLILWLATPASRAQENSASQKSAEPTVQDTLGWHVVRGGETLQSITEHYLGTTRLWLANARLNPGIQSPYRIYQGQRLRVIVKREIPAQQVEIRKVARLVHKSLRLADWEDATAGDLLKPLDGVRTQQKSSTELHFDDGSFLTMGEYSTVFVKDASTTLRGVRRGTIEIKKGQAELVFKAQRPDSTEIEVITGDAVTRPQIGPAGTSRTRARKSEDGGSRVMIYGGKAEVESGGAKVAVGRGMGTAVPQGRPPKPPEKLLPRPETVSPARRSEWAYANPLIRWRPVAGATTYMVEICGDATCGQLVTLSQLEATTWIPDALPVGELYWRVTARAASGLDGYPSRAVPFKILVDQPDLQPPMVVARLRGSGDSAPDGFVLSDGGRIELIAHDDAAGVAEIRYRWGDGGWTLYRAKALAPPAASSPTTKSHRLEWQATDHLGRESQVWSAQVTVDKDPPPVPTIEIPQAPLSQG